MTPQCRTRATSQQGRSAPDLRVLFDRCADGDPAAREAIIVQFLPYARRLARRYAGRGEPVDDLYQVASVGLIKAVDRCEPERCDSFIAFAEPTILGEIRRHFRDGTRRVHVPRPVQDCARKVTCAQQELATSCGSHPTTEMVAKHLNLAIGEVAEAQRACEASRPASLDATYPAHDGQPLALSETVGELDRQYERVETSVACAPAVRRLAPRERTVLLLRFGGELTQDEIARRIGVSQMQVSRILRGILAALAAAAELQ